ncbi:MAG: response regulator [Candidatus Gracilibacteria bacterium]
MKNKNEQMKDQISDAEKSVYLIDDSEINTKLLKQMMEYYAFKTLNRVCRVETFSNAKDAFEAILVNTPDTVITDQRMPGMKGTDLVNAILESDQIISKPKIILLSGDTNLKEISDLRKAKHESVKAILDKTGHREQTYEMLNIVFDIQNKKIKPVHRRM